MSARSWSAGFGLVIAALMTMMLVMAYPTNTAITFASDPEILITAVPTMSALVASPTDVQQPTLSANVDNPPVEATALVQAATPLMRLEPLIDPSLSLNSGPVSVPLEIRIPALKINAPVMGVGLTANNAMAAPIGLRDNDPIWESVFWYRGGGVPGEIGTATFAGHLDDSSGRPAIFAYLGDLHIGDLIVVHDQRTGLDISFIVTEIKTYTDAEAADPEVLAGIFGSAATNDAEVDHSSRLTLITCGGAWVDGGFSLRLVVYATRASYPLDFGELSRFN